jgi:hypothetical protein
LLAVAGATTAVHASPANTAAAAILCTPILLPPLDLLVYQHGIAHRLSLQPIDAVELFRHVCIETGKALETRRMDPDNLWTDAAMAATKDSQFRIL